jgi:hypothetical protein
MANNHWVRDRIINILRKELTIGAAALLKDLEKKYNITLSYYVVFDGRQMALEEIEGKWDDSFDDTFLNGCRPFLGVDSTVLTGRWRGQLASASACMVSGSGC